MIQKRLQQKDSKSKKTGGNNCFFKGAIKSLGFLFVFLAGVSLIVASGGGGSSTTSTSSSSETTSASASLATYQMPTEISAVPIDTDAGDTSAMLNASLRSTLMSLTMAAADAGTDYSNAETRRFVEEHALEQFDMLENVLDALAQTHYYEEIGNDPYTAMVAMKDESEGKQTKRLEKWVCQSEAITENGADVLRARAWIEEQDMGETLMVKAEFKVSTPPTRNDDGSYSDYGEWSLNVKFDDDGEDDYFAATCSNGETGQSIIKVHEKFLEDELPIEGDFVVDAKGIMYRSQTEGYGKVSFPEWDKMFGPDSDPDMTAFPMLEASYAYNANYLAVKATEDSNTVYKDRNEIVEMTHHYGVYNADTGDNIMKTKSFGFPIKWTDGDSTKRAYYGAWQGRHQLWSQDGNSIAEETSVTKENFGHNETPETYTVGPTFNGVLVKRTYVTASLNDIKDIAVEIWVDNQYNLTYNVENEKWWHCADMNFNDNSCNDTLIDFGAVIGFEGLMVGENDNRKWVNISGWDNINNTNKEFMYILADQNEDVNTDGLYEAEWAESAYGGMRLTLKSPPAPINTSNVTNLWINSGGSIYVMWNGTNWVEKELINFDQRTWTPEFGENDKTFLLPENRELYINMQGSNYVVRKSGETTTVQLELQTPVTPENAANMIPAGTVFKDPWNPDTNSTYELDTDSDSDTYLMLLYKTIGQNDTDFDSDTGEATPREGIEVGGIVQNIWGIETTFAGDDDPTAFNWEYSADGGWGAVTYLKNTDGTYKMLDDPIRFASTTALNGAGEEKTISLQYDGWMMGLPEMHWELEKNGWNMTEELADKIINLTAGFQLTGIDGTEYLLKPLEVSQFLMDTSETEGLPEITLGEDVDLSTVPVFTEHGMGDMPTGTDIKYSEGIAVTTE